MGSRIALVAHFLGRRIAYTYEVRELVRQLRAFRPLDCELQAKVSAAL